MEMTFDQIRRRRDPPRQAIRVDVTDDRGGRGTPRVMDVQWRSHDACRARQRLAAEDGESGALLICGCFRASFGVSIDPFAGLSCAIVEQFDATDEYECRLKAALVELNAQQIGMRAMTASSARSGSLMGTLLWIIAQ
jgi:AraC family transcriptional activator of mtrCDE